MGLGQSSEEQQRRLATLFHRTGLIEMQWRRSFFVSRVRPIVDDHR